MPSRIGKNSAPSARTNPPSSVPEYGFPERSCSCPAARNFSSSAMSPASASVNDCRVSGQRSNASTSSATMAGGAMRLVFRHTRVDFIGPGRDAPLDIDELGEAGFLQELESARGTRAALALQGDFVGT